VATKAETHRSQSERTGRARRKSFKPTFEGPPRELEATKATAGAEPQGEHPTRVESKAAFAYEPTPDGRPSRKSTRRGANRVKPDSNLRRRQTRATSSPESRAAREQAQGR
jgi:hypothetical protein